MVRRAFLAKMGGEEPERHASDRKPKPNYNPGRVKHAVTPDTKITGKHIKPDGEALALPLEQLTETMCHFPFGAAAPFKFCGRTTLINEPYCQKHYHLTHTHQHRGD